MEQYSIPSGRRMDNDIMNAVIASFPLEPIFFSGDGVIEFERALSPIERATLKTAVMNTLTQKQIPKDVSTL